ncbi:hypothetical protein Y032_0083g1618 [Ancylostoma ceylanicum]|uniref:Uncharacterized protein n=1 Tax=Ancylostoma ceylanicum TaxID=53326 RepID=A0A016TQX4_9BILA|nr:hypothetical protein Y032_0083g1618 [Ancylostoma ceylanicum]
MVTYNELKTGVDKGRDRGVAFSGRKQGLCMLALVVCLSLLKKPLVYHFWSSLYIVVLISQHDFEKSTLEFSFGKISVQGKDPGLEKNVETRRKSAALNKFCKFLKKSFFGSS